MFKGTVILPTKSSISKSAAEIKYDRGTYGYVWSNKITERMDTKNKSWFVPWFLLFFCLSNFIWFQANHLSTFSQRQTCTIKKDKKEKGIIINTHIQSSRKHTH